MVAKQRSVHGRYVMEELTNEEIFINVVKRVNHYLIIMGVFFLVYFLLQTKVDIFLFLLALSNMGFAFLSYKHVIITDRLAIELKRARETLGDVEKEMREIHPDLNA